jgi:N-acetylglutamate synthase
MVEIFPFDRSNYDDVMTLWQASEGLTLRAVDSRDALTSYLARNSGFSFVAREGGRIVAAVLAGSDGRRGYLQHLAVAPTHRGRGLGRALAERVVEALCAAGISKCHAIVRRDQPRAREFWVHLGWIPRDDVTLMSYTAPGEANA